MMSTQKGYDEDITHVTVEYAESIIPDAMAKFGTDKDSRFFSMKFPGPDNNEFIITKPTYIGIGSPTGQSTHTFKALCVATKKLVSSKDTWRVIHPGILPKHKIYTALASKRNFPCHHIGHLP